MCRPRTNLVPPPCVSPVAAATGLCVPKWAQLDFKSPFSSQAWGLVLPNCSVCCLHFAFCPCPAFGATLLSSAESLGFVCSHIALVLVALGAADASGFQL